MTMVAAVILTFLITALLMMVLFLFDATGKQTRENEKLLAKNRALQNQITDFNNRDQYRRERGAYDRGLYDGRQTDALYRNVLKRYSAREQVDVMMNGEGQCRAK